MIKSEYKYSEQTEAIIEAALEVHSRLGCGFQEVIYQRALDIEFNLRNIPAKREFEMHIFFKNYHIGTRRVDFLVFENISVELKEITALEAVHFAQGINYLEAYNIEIGLIINFGKTSLEFKRLKNKGFKSKAGSHNSNQINQSNHTNQSSDY